MQEDAKRDEGVGTQSSLREEWEKAFEDHFGLAWNASSKEQVLAAVRIRKNAFLMLREIERVAAGVFALYRLLHGQPPPEEDPPPCFGPDRKHDERFLLMWAFEEGLVPFASHGASPRAIAAVSLLMGYEQDSHEEGAFDRACERMKASRKRYRQSRPPTAPEVQERIAQAKAFRVIEAPLRQALDALMEMFGGTIHHGESVPAVTVSQS